MYDKFLAAQAQLWAISPQPQETNRRFRERRSIPYPILQDVDLAVIQRWGVLHTHNPDEENIPYPSTYVVAQNGRIHWRRLGHDKKDRPTAEEVLAALP